MKKQFAASPRKEHSLLVFGWLIVLADCSSQKIRQREKSISVISAGSSETSEKYQNPRGFVAYAKHQEGSAFLIHQSNKSECVPRRAGLSSKSDIV